MNTTHIETWFTAAGYTLDDVRSDHERGYSHPSGAYLVINSAIDDEPPFWAYYRPDSDGEQPDQTGSWDEYPSV